MIDAAGSVDQRITVKYQVHDEDVQVLFGDITAASSELRKLTSAGCFQLLRRSLAGNFVVHQIPVHDQPSSSNRLK